MFRSRHRATRPSAIAFLVLFSACAEPTAPPATASGAPPAAGSAAPLEVPTAVAELTSWERSVRAVGSLFAYEEATLATKVPGRLVEISVDLATPIRAGEIVARIQRRDYELAVARAEASLGQARAALGLPATGESDEVDPEATAPVREARANLAEALARHERIVALKEQGISTLQEEDEVDRALRVAESRLQRALEDVAMSRVVLTERRVQVAIARAALADTDVAAPFDGATLARLAGTGDYLSAGDPIARVARLDPLRLRLEIPERESALVRVGQKVRIELESAGQVRQGAIARISPVITASNRTLVVEAEIPNPTPTEHGSNGHASERDGALRPGAFVRAEIVVDSAASAVTVPPEAVLTFAGLDKVIAIVEGAAVEKRVVLGRRAADRIEVLSGLEAGTVVVLSPGGLRPGAPVRPTN